MRLKGIQDHLVYAASKAYSISVDTNLHSYTIRLYVEDGVDSRRDFPYKPYAYIKNDCKSNINAHAFQVFPTIFRVAGTTNGKI